VKKLIAASSSCAFPDLLPRHYYPLDESWLFDGKPAQSNFEYAIAKRAMCALIMAYRKAGFKDYCYLNFSNMFGEHDTFDLNRSHFLTALIYQFAQVALSKRDCIMVGGSGKPLRQFTYTDDVARAISEIVKASKYKILNVATDEVHSISEFVQIVAKALRMESVPIKQNKEIPDGQFRKDISSYRFLKEFPDFKFTPVSEACVKVFQSCRKKLESESL